MCSFFLETLTLSLSLSLNIKLLKLQSVKLLKVYAWSPVVCVFRRLRRSQEKTLTSISSISVNLTHVL